MKAMTTREMAWVQGGMKSGDMGFFKDGEIKIGGGGGGGSDKPIDRPPGRI